MKYINEEFKVGDVVKIKESMKGKNPCGNSSKELIKGTILEIKDNGYYNLRVDKTLSGNWIGAEWSFTYNFLEVVVPATFNDNYEIY